MSTSEGKVLVLVRKPPGGNKDAFEALRVTLGLYAGEMEAAVLLLGDGVYNAVAGIDPKLAGHPSTRSFLEELGLCAIVPKIVQEDLAARGLVASGLVPGVEVISRETAAQLLRGHGTVVAF